MDKGIAVGGVITGSDQARAYNMDLLGNLNTANALAVNGVNAAVKFNTNATNEITTAERANPAGAPEIIDDAFTSSLSGIWSAEDGTWSISSGKVNTDTLTGGQAVLLADADLDQVNYALEVTFPASSSTNRAGLEYTATSEAHRLFARSFGFAGARRTRLTGWPATTATG